MNEKFRLKQLVLLTVFYLIVELMELVTRQYTGVAWYSPRDLKELLGLIAISLLWIWHLADKFQKK